MQHWLTNKAYLSPITVTNISQRFTYKMTAKMNWHRYGTKISSLSPYVQVYCMEARQKLGKEPKKQSRSVQKASVGVPVRVEWQRIPAAFVGKDLRRSEFEAWGPIYKISYDNLSIMPKLRSTYDGRLIYKNILHRAQGFSVPVYITAAGLNCFRCTLI